MANSEINLSKVTVQNLQQHLVDIRMPDPVGWWPIAPGWWIVMSMVLILVIWRLNRSRSSTLKFEADQLLEQLQVNEDAALYWHRMTRLLRDTAVKGSTRAAVARLQGNEWVAWLENAVDNTFSARVKALLSDECYRKSPAMPDQAVHNELVNWLERYSQRDKLKRSHSA